MIDQEQIDRTPTYKPRNGFIAFFFSLLCPGLGQIYNGQPKKGIAIISICLLLPFIFGITRLSVHFYGLLTLFIIEMIFRLYLIIDAVVFAVRQKNYILKPYNTWYYYLLIFLGLVGIGFVYDFRTAMGAETFSVATTANEPTIMKGDYVVADCRAYKNSEPQCGDMVVFRFQNEYRIYRIIGLPNDHVELKDNIVSINNKASRATFIKEVNVDEYGLAEKYMEYEEVLPNGHSHRIYRLKGFGDLSKANLSIDVPPGHYYLLGDSRDNAADGRYFGLIPREAIKGRFVFTYWGKTSERINVDLRDK